MEETNASEAVFRFLDLPREIRNIIYCYLLLSKHVFKRVPNPEFYNWQSGSGDLNLPVREYNYGRRRGALQCRNAWIEDSLYTMGLLRVNHQLFAEASTIFHLENTWLVVHFGTRGITQGLLAAGFSLFPYEGKPIVGGEQLHLWVDHPQWANDSGETIMMSMETAVKFPGVLCIAQGLSELRLHFDLSSIRNAASPEFGQVLDAFHKLRGVGQAVVSNDDVGFLKPECLRSMEIDPFGPWYGQEENGPMVMEDLVQELKDSMGHAQQRAQTHQWQNVADECETSLARVAQFYFVYHSIVLRRRYSRMYVTMIDVVMQHLELVIKAKMELCQYHCVLRYTHHIKGVLVCQNKALFDCYRGLAYARLGQRLKALNLLKENADALLTARYWDRAPPSDLSEDRAAFIWLIQVEIEHLQENPNGTDSELGGATKVLENQKLTYLQSGMGGSAVTRENLVGSTLIHGSSIIQKKKEFKSINKRCSSLCDKSQLLSLLKLKLGSGTDCEDLYKLEPTFEGLSLPQ